MTNDQHNSYISWAFIGHAAFQIFMGLMMVVFLSMFLPRGSMTFMFGFIFVFQVAFAIPSVIAAYGLRKKRKWARIASIVAGVVSAMNVPIGTAACVYALWFFLSDNWKEVYPEVAFGRDEKAAALQLAHERETRWTGHHTDEKGEVIFNTVDPPDWR